MLNGKKSICLANEVPMSNKQNKMPGMLLSEQNILYINEEKVFGSKKKTKT